MPGCELRPSSETIWSGVYSTWFEAVMAAETRNVTRKTRSAFDSQRWIQRQRGMLRATRNGAMPRHTCMPVLAAGIAARSIVDFGGGSGWAYELLDSLTKSELTQYLVIEQSTVSEAFAEDFPSETRVRLLAGDDVLPNDLKKSIDLLYSNSTLQYLPDNDFFLYLVELGQPKFILLDDFQTSQDTEFFSMQHYYGTEIPCRFSSIGDLDNDLSKFNYRFVGCWPYPKAYGGTLEPRIARSPGDTRKTRGIGVPRTLLFSRTSS